MPLIEGLYLPRLGVIKKEAHLSRKRVAEVIAAEYAAKGVCVGNPQNPDEVAAAIGNLDNQDLSHLLSNLKIQWDLETWPIKFLKMTQIQPPEKDVFGLHPLVMASGKRFQKFAETVKQLPRVIEEDQGFQMQPERDKLPIIGVRGILNNHILTGHHRTTLALWNGQSNMQVITAYRR